MEYITEARKKQVNRIRKRRRRKRIMRRIVLMLCLVLLAAAAVRGAWFVVQTVAAGRTQKTESAVSAVETAEASSRVQTENSLPVRELSQSEKLACILEDDIYPEQLKEMAQKNSETIDFVYNYPKLKDETWNIDLTEESQLNQVPLLMQWDERWGYTSYNGGILGYTG